MFGKKKEFVGWREAQEHWEVIVHYTNPHGMHLNHTLVCSKEFVGGVFKDITTESYARSEAKNIIQSGVTFTLANGTHHFYPSSAIRGVYVQRKEEK